MPDLSIPLLRQAAVLGNHLSHPRLSRLSAYGVGLVTGAAAVVMDDGPYCDDGGCHTWEFCMAGDCNGAACGWWCHSLTGYCESGGSCWKSGPEPFPAETCCDCMCCYPGMPCYNCICSS